MSCCYCSTTEGEPELHPLRNTNHSTPLQWIFHSASLQWCHDERPCSGTISYGIPRMVQISTQLTKRGVSSEFHTIIKGEEWTVSQICLPSLLPSKWLYHIIITTALHTCQPMTVQECIHHLKPCLGRSETNMKPIALDYKTHTMATCHGGAGFTP